MPCAGNSAEMCGADRRISVYRPGKIAAITASSEYTTNHGATNARLNFKSSSRAWVAATNNADQWLQFDMGQRSTVGVIRTQGRLLSGHYNQWVTSYSISYGNSSGDEMWYKDANGDTIVFTGNSDIDSLVTHVLVDYNGPFHARYVRFRPVTWSNHISMRADIAEVAPVGFWPLNGHTQLRDVSGYGNDATGVGVALANGVHGESEGAYSLSGSSTSYIEIPNNGMLDTRYSMTILAYFYPTGTDGPIFHYRTNDYGVHFWQKDTGYLYARMRTRDNVYKDVLNVDTLNLNEWNFVGMTYNYPLGKVKLWHDGTEVGSRDVGTFETQTDYDIRVGLRDGDSRTLQGRVACLQVYNIPLNSDQIRDAARKCRAAQPVGLWPLNKQYGLADISGNGNDVTGVNVALGTGVYGEPEGSYVMSGSSTSYIEVPDDRTLDTRYSLTILASVYPTGGAGPILQYGDSASGVHLWQDSTYFLLARVYSRNATSNQTTQARCLKPNQWNFVGLTYNYSTGMLKLWYEGLELVSTDIGVYELGTNHAARIGAVGSDHFKGSVSCVQIYDVALNKSQIEHAAKLCIGNNIAVGKTATQSSSFPLLYGFIPKAPDAVDGYKGSDTNLPACAHTQLDFEPWWKLDLGGSYVIGRVRLQNRRDGSGNRLEEFQVRVGENSDISQNSICGRTTNQLDDPPESRSITVDCDQPITGRYVSVQLIDRTQYLTLCEVEVFEVQGNDAGWLTLDSSSVTSSAGTPHDDGGTVYDASKTLDGNLFTYWRPTGVTDNNYFVTFDLQEYHWLSKIRVVSYEEDDTATHHIAAFTIKTLDPAGGWGDVTSFSGLAGRQVKAFTGFVALSRYWQVDITQTSHGLEPYVAEIQLYGRLGANIAQGKTAFQSSTYEPYAANRAVDGSSSTWMYAGSCSHTQEESDPRWWVDLGQSYTVDRVVILNRQDCCWGKLNPFNIHIGDSDQVSTNPQCGGDHEIAQSQAFVTILCPSMQGRYVGIRLPGSARALHICEVQVFSGPVPEAVSIEEPTYHCNGDKPSYVTMATKGTITSGDHGWGNYSSDSLCSWTIEAPSGMAVSLTFLTFDLADDGDCLSDYVAVYDGSSQSSELLGRFCEGNPGVVNSTGNLMHVTFVSNSSLEAAGFRATFGSLDIDECATGNGGCSQNCNNTVGSFACSCHDGYSLNSDGASCDDVDECASNNGGCEKTCTNNVGSFQCSCDSGLTLNSNNLTCDDIDECATGNGGCLQNCSNTVGSFACSCHVGYSLNSDGISCDDIDECADSNGGCEHVCTNTEGSFQCSCHLGQTLNGDGLNCDGWGLPETCPTNGLIHLPNNKTYVAPSDEQVDYATAQARCAIIEGTVAVTRDWNELEYFVFYKNCLSSADVFWVGITRQADTWVDSQGTAISDFTAWAPGEPDQDRDCSLIVQGDLSPADQRRDRWRDNSCNGNIRYICESMTTAIPTTTSSPTTPAPSTTTEASTTMARSTAGASVSTTSPTTTTSLPSTTAAASSTVDQSITVTAVTTTTPMPDATTAASTTIIRSTAGASVPTTSATTTSLPSSTAATSSTVDRSTTVTPVTTTTPTPDATTAVSTTIVRSTAGASVFTTSATTTSLPSTTAAASSTENMSTKITAITATSPSTTPTPGATTSASTTGIQSTAGAAVSSSTQPSNTAPKTTVTAAESAAETTTSSPTTPAPDTTTAANTTADRSTAGAATSTSAQRTTPAPITTASTAKSTTSAPTTSATDTITAANTTADWSTAGASVSTTSPQTTPGRNTTAEFNTTVSSSTTETGITITPTSMTPALNTRAGNSTKVVSSTTGAAVTNTPDLETVTLVLAIPISWNTSYEDPTSPAFKELEAEIVALISDLYSNVSGFAGVVVQGISRQDTSVAASVGVKFVGGVTSEEEVSTVLATALQSSVLAIGGVAVTAVSIGNMTVTGNSSLCDSFTCADHAVCIEIGDGAKCVCQPGYEGNGTIHCTDIDECATGSHVCLRDELCFNREGSYACASCYPNIALVGAGANSSAPVDIKRRVPFTVQSTVTTDCNVTYFFFFNWTLYSMDGVLPAVKISLPKTVETSGSELSLPKNVLPYGKVVIRLEVTVEETLSGFRVVMFAEQWVNVLSSALVADIAGGSARSLAPGSDIILDASSSTDPDAMVVNSADFTYSWTCDTEIGTPCTYLFGDGGTGQSYTIPSDNVQTNAGWMTVHLSVWFPGRSAGTTSQFLEIFPVGSPSTYIRCFSNCNRKINPSEKIVLVSECSNCEENEQVSYNWTLQEAPDQFGRFDLNWDTETTTGRNLPDVVIKPEVFTALGEYALRLETTLDDGRQGFSEYSFEPNLPPVEGSCTVSPENGTAMVTEFIIACKGFSDIDEPLTYTFLFNTGTASTFSPLYTGTEPQTPPQLLPVGQESRDFVVRIQVQVSDALGATSTVETSVMVLALPVEHSTAVASQLVVGENSPLTKLVREGDAKSLVQMSNSVTSVLNSVPDNASAEAKKAATEAREALVSALTTIKPTSVSSVNLVASALGSATGGGDEVSADSQVAAANSLKNMAGFLQSIPSEDLEIGQIEKSSSFMFTAVVNVMAGSSKVSDKSKSSEDGETDSDQLEKAKQATQDIFNAIDTMNELMINRKRPNEKPTVITQGPFEMALQRQNCRDMRSQIVRPSENSDTWFRIPDASALFGQSCGQSVGLENYHTSLNPYSYADTSGKIKSPVASLKFRGDSGPVGVNDLQVPIDVMMPQKPGAVVVQAERGQTTPTGQDVMSMHTFNVTEAESSVHVTVTPDVEGIPVRLFLGINSAPSRQVYNRTASLPLVVDSLYSIPLGNNTYLRPDPFQWFLAASDLELTGSEQLFLGVDHEPFTNDTTTNSTVKWGDLSEALELGKGGVNFTLNYTLKIFTSKCLFFDEGQQQWISDGCEVGPLTSTYLTHCLCNHLTAFGSDFQFFVAPNSLNILSALQGFANIGENPSVVITIGVLFGLYLVAVIWARWEDKKDVSKVGATVLKGAGRNSQSYQVQVFTGTRANAGTSSQVFLVLKGERGQSGPHVLEDKTRITFKQGAVDTFVVTSPLPLGPIQSAHIWHNNIGPYPSWFLEQVIVTDLQEDAKHVFLCKSWLAVEEGDGKVDREIYKATDKDLTRFGRLFSTKTSKDFRDGHLWFSVIGRPATSPFTRVQRVSCCLSLLMCTMLTNIMFFGKGDTMQKPPPVYILGFEVQFPISWGQIMIGIQSALMVIPVNLLIVQIFRNCAARPSRKIKGKPVDMRHIPRKDPEGRASSASSSGTKADPAFAGKSTTYEVLSEGESTSSAEASETISQAAERKESSHQTIVSVEEVGHTDDGADNVEESYDATVMKGDPSKLAKKKKKRLLPWWCIFFAWFLVFATCSLSAFFTMLYGFEYGREKAEAWVLTFLTSFFFDLAISQPIKILLIGFLFALIIKKPDSLEDDVPPAQLYEDEEFAGLQSDEIEDPIDETAPEQTGPPDQGALAVAREQRFVELGFRDACYDFVFYISYILLLLVIANGNRDQYFYRMSTHLRGTFVEPFSEVNDFESFWTFVRGSIVSDLHDVKWYNEEPLNRPGFLSDTSSFIVGHPRLRQVRVSPDVSCDVPDPMMSVVTDCDSLYSLLGSDDSSYDVGWTRVNVTFDVSSRENVSDDQVPWIYEPASLSAAVPDTGEHGTYYGGGYIVELSNSSNADMDIIDELQDVGWIDDNTRAVFIEFIVYNANANLFAVFNLLAEFTNLGRAFPQSEIMIVRLYPYTTAWGFVLLGCHGVFFLITLYLTYREARRILTLGTEYFKMFWRVVELVLSLLALAEVGVHLYTAYLILGFNNSQNSDNGDQRYNKYKQAASWEKINTYIIGWLVCVACLKLLYLCRFSKNIQRGPKVARKAWAPLSNFMIMFTIFFTAYSLFAHLVFGAKLGMYGTFIRTLETLFSVMLGDMNYDTVKSANDILGPLMLLSFVVLVSNILVLMFLAILSDAYSEVVEEEQIQGKSENDKIKDYAMYRLRKLLQKKPNSVDIAKHTCTSEAEISTISDRPISIPTRHMDGKSRMDYVSEEKNTSENELEQRGLEEDWQMLRSYYVGKLDVEDPVITWSEDPYREKRPEIEIARRRSSTCHPRRPSSGIDEAVVHESQISETAGSADMASSVDVTGGNQQNGVGTTGRCSSGVQTRRRSSGILHTTSEARSLDNESKCDGPAGSLRSVNVAEETRQEENRTVGRRNSGMPDTLPSTEIEDDSPNNTSIRESNRGNQARPVDLAWAAGPSGEKQEGEVGTDRGSGRLLKRQSTIVSFGGVELPLPGVFDLEVEDV
ncbi:uncharacterized protein LOC118413477 isoform X10 [Branchiostoma floridae]|uniref:Uncharacterized protein LOC118413477 isoform X10 n=1 Tax=Branchiostoma floridae TaxID=7739 RepID=A0A9J7KYV2_BRAFL|nr:uncharacterized protein LOC118413477 isoform X10 [Branchiostoma floridae]